MTKTRKIWVGNEPNPNNRVIVEVSEADYRRIHEAHGTDDVVEFVDALTGTMYAVRYIDCGLGNQCRCALGFVPLPQYNENDCACGGTGAVPGITEEYEPCPDCTQHFPHFVRLGTESCAWCGMLFPDGRCPSLEHPRRLSSVLPQSKLDKAIRKAKGKNAVEEMVFENSRVQTYRLSNDSYLDVDKKTGRTSLVGFKEFQMRKQLQAETRN